MTYHIFIGYDEREHEPFLVAKHSLLKHAKVPVKVHQLHHRKLREAGLFTREWTTTVSGQYVDNVDGLPFSTQFSHTRFLVPELWRNISDTDKNSLVMFVDCDFVWLNDIGEMFKGVENQKILNGGKFPLHCTQHDYKPKTEVKMDNVVQTNYNMKLWSAMTVFDMDHPDNQKLTPELVNTKPGRWLHNFCWLSNVHAIGNIKPSWHFIPNHSESVSEEINAIHYTEGGPWFEKYRNTRYSQVWWKEYNDYLKSKLLSVNFDVEGMIDG
jgi:hypothetical protein